MGEIGFDKLLLIVVVVLLLFGARRLPEIGASLGKGIREFKRNISDTGGAGGAQLTDRAPPSRPPDEASPQKGDTGEPRRLSQ